MLSPKEILIKYWGHTCFLPMQEEIIQAVLEKKDTLALLPTGGGKSVCFQVPTLMKEGVCIVISPLISLMQDQVEHLKSKGIKSVAITSNLSKEEVDISLNNCIYGDYKFLYLSPERLQNKIVHEKIKQMNVNLITVDEAHCIAEWGYDFRPAYLHIGKIKELLPDVPILALTATATNDIINNIQEKLLFRAKHVLQSSFVRENLSYVVINTEQKKQKLVKILNYFKSSAIVYVGSRKQTKAITQILRNNNISSDFYHAGLDIDLRNQKQKKWKHNEIRVMVATNAFGMGINKEDVRIVVHINTPSSLEGYFQEAGRAGRDGNLAYAILLTNKTDRINMSQFILSQYPSIQEIRDCYQKIADYFHIAVNSAEGKSFEFNIHDFCEKYQLNTFKTYNILKYLEIQQYIKLTDAFNTQSKLHFSVSPSDLYHFQIANSYYESFIKLLLRLYTGIFESYVTINEENLAQKFNTSTKKIINLLEKLQQLEILKYIPNSNAPKLIFTQNRIEVSSLQISKELLKERKKLKHRKLHSVIKYAENNTLCRTQQLLKYFGEEKIYNCGKCDVCIERNKIELSEIELKKIHAIIKKLLKRNPLATFEIVNQISHLREEKILKVLEWLSENKQVKLSNGKYIWIS